MTQTIPTEVDSSTSVRNMLERVGAAPWDDLHIQLFKHPLAANLKRVSGILIFTSLLWLGFSLGKGDFTTILQWVESLDITLDTSMFGKILLLIFVLGIRPAKPALDGWMEVPYEEADPLDFQHDQLYLIKKMMRTAEWAKYQVQLTIERRQNRRLLKVRRGTDVFYIAGWSV